MFQRLDKTFFQDPKELNGLINTGNLVQKFLPKQIDMDKFRERYLKEHILQLR